MAPLVSAAVTGCLDRGGGPPTVEVTAVNATDATQSYELVVSEADAGDPVAAYEGTLAAAAESVYEVTLPDASDTYDLVLEVDGESFRRTESGSGLYSVEAVVKTGATVDFSVTNT